MQASESTETFSERSKSDLNLAARFWLLEVFYQYGEGKGLKLSHLYEQAQNATQQIAFDNAANQLIHAVKVRAQHLDRQRAIDRLADHFMYGSVTPASLITLEAELDSLGLEGSDSIIRRNTFHKIIKAHKLSLAKLNSATISAGKNVPRDKDRELISVTATAESLHNSRGSLETTRLSTEIKANPKSLIDKAVGTETEIYAEKINTVATSRPLSETPTLDIIMELSQRIGTLNLADQNTASPRLQTFQNWLIEIRHKLVMDKINTALAPNQKHPSSSASTAIASNLPASACTADTTKIIATTPTISHAMPPRGAQPIPNHFIGGGARRPQKESAVVSSDREVAVGAPAMFAHGTASTLATEKPTAQKSKSSHNKLPDTKKESPITKSHHQPIKSVSVATIEPTMTEEGREKAIKTRTAALFGENSIELGKAMKSLRKLPIEGEAKPPHGRSAVVSGNGAAVVSTASMFAHGAALMLPTTKSAAPKNKTSQSEWSESEHDSPITKPHHQSTKSEPTHVISPAITKEEQAKTTQTRGAALFGANSEVLKTAMQLRRASLPEGNR